MCPLVSPKDNTSGRETGWKGSRQIRKQSTEESVLIVMHDRTACMLKREGRKSLHVRQAGQKDLHTRQTIRE